MYATNIETNLKNNVEEELDRVEEELDNQKKLVDDLVWKRSELLIKKQNLEFSALADCIYENGLTANEALELLILALRTKQILKQ
jgi:hypothetical protein